MRIAVIGAGGTGGLFGGLLARASNDVQFLASGSHLAAIRARGLEMRNAAMAADGRRALWQKAAALIPLATLTSVCEQPMGPILALPETRALAQTLLGELARVGRACGYDLAGLEERAMAQLDRVPPTMK